MFAFSGLAELVKLESPSKTKACPAEEQRAEGQLGQGGKKISFGLGKTPVLPGSYFLPISF